MTDLFLDEREVVRLAVRYCRSIDTRDWALLATVFTPDATAVLGSSGLLDGRDAIVGLCRHTLTTLDLTQHMVSNHEIEIDDDTATHHCYVHAQHVRKGASGGSKLVIAGAYDDRLVRTDDGWRITHRELTVMWSDGNPAVVAVD